MEIVNLVVPLFNEASRFQQQYWIDLLSIDSIHWIFVDDGSTDATYTILQSLPHPERREILRLTTNVGKGEAVRVGFLHFFESTARNRGLNFQVEKRTSSGLVGFMDADGAFTSDDISRILNIAQEKIGGDLPTPLNLESTNYDSVWASRVAMSGRNILRTPSRHYLGRIVSTLLFPFVPSMPYDSQCGFKIFGATGQFEDSISTPFKTKWFFDLEILINWIEKSGTEMKIWEEPLNSWKDIPGSHLTFLDSFKIVGEIWTLIAKSRKSLPRRINVKASRGS